MNYYWDWGFFFQTADDGNLYWEWVANAWAMTLLVSLVAFCIALTLGTLVGTGRTTNSRIIRYGCTAYTEVFRNIPLLVQLFLWFFVLPELLARPASLWMKTQLSPWVLGSVGLGLYTSARIAEQIRAGLTSLSSGQKSAAMAIGMRPIQIYAYVLLPNAFRRVFPTLTTEAMSILKNSSVTFVVGVLELTFQYRQIIEKTSQVFEITIVNLLIYMLSAVTVFSLATLYEQRVLLRSEQPLTVKKAGGSANVI